jgi:hypothetical protein
MKFTMILGSAAALVLASATATSAAPTEAASVSPAIVAVSAPLAVTALQQPPPPKAEIKVDIDTSPNTVWYTDPVWLAVGAIALLVIIVLAVMAARGGSDRTTVVR